MCVCVLQKVWYRALEKNKHHLRDDAKNCNWSDDVCVCGLFEYIEIQIKIKPKNKGIQIFIHKIGSIRLPHGTKTRTVQKSQKQNYKAYTTQTDTSV